jgi:hypothetical protein
VLLSITAIAVLAMGGIPVTDGIAQAAADVERAVEV